MPLQCKLLLWCNIKLPELIKIVNYTLLTYMIPSLKKSYGKPSKLTEISQKLRLLEIETPKNPEIMLKSLSKALNPLKKPELS